MRMAKNPKRLPARHIESSAEQLSSALEESKKELDNWLLQIKLWQKSDQYPSSLLAAQFDDLAESINGSLYEFGRRITSFEGFNSLGDAEEQFWWAQTNRYMPRDLESSFLEIDIFLDVSKKELIQDASLGIDEVLEAIGATVVFRSPEIWGSWRRKIAASVASNEVIEKAAESIKAAIVNLPQAQANSENADGISKLIHAIDTSRNAVMRFGTVLIVKVTTDGDAAIVTTDLSRQQQRALDRHPDWLIEPKLLLARLAEVEEPPAEELPAGDEW